MIDLSKFSFKKSLLLVAISTIILFAVVDFLVYRPVSILTAPEIDSPFVQGFSTDVSGFAAGFSQMFLLILIFTSIIQGGFAIFSWWASAVAADYSATRIFKLQTNHEHLIPAFAIIYSTMAIIASISFLVSFETIASNILWRIGFIVIGWFLYIFAIKDIYEIGWRKAFLIDLAGALILAGITIAGYIVGAGIGLVAGLIL